MLPSRTHESSEVYLTRRSVERRSHPPPTCGHAVSGDWIYRATTRFAYGASAAAVTRSGTPGAIYRPDVVATYPSAPEPTVVQLPIAQPLGRGWSSHPVTSLHPCGFGLRRAQDWPTAGLCSNASTIPDAIRNHI